MHATHAAQSTDRPEPPGSGDEVTPLWAAFKTDGDLAARQALIERHLGFARYVAWRCYAQRMRDGVAFSDYQQLAIIGLIEAVDRFDPLLGRASFETYASHRIRGAVLNGLTSMSEVNAQIEARRRTHRSRLATLAEVDEAAPAGHDEFERFADLATGMALGFMLDDVRIFQTSEGEVADNSYSDAEMHKLRSTLERLIRTLPERESHLLRAHYFNDLPFETVAEDFGLSKGRVSQLHKRALASLHSSLAALHCTEWLV